MLLQLGMKREGNLSRHVSKLCVFFFFNSVRQVDGAYVQL